MFHSPRGLYSFQAEFCAYGYLRPANLVVADTGLGKTIIGLATAAMLFEDNQIDLVIYVVERNKLDEWKEDIHQFTTFSCGVYHGSGRAKVIEKMPQAIVTTYATSKADLSDGGPLSTVVRNAGLRVFVVYDEMALFGSSRTSIAYEAHHKFISRLRKFLGVRVMGLTATPMSTSPENYFNIIRILDPGLAGTVDQFYATYVAGYDAWGKPNAWRNLSPDDCDPNVVSLAERFAPIILRKRKTDPDVVDKFPKLVEKFVPIRLEDEHLRAYESLDAFLGQLPESKSRFAFQTLVAFTGHPRSIFNSGSDAVQEWITQYGPNRLLKLSSAKTAALQGTIREILHQNEDDSVLVFAFHSSVLRCLSADLGKVPHVVYDGSLSQKGRDAAKSEFRSKRVRVMLASSAAERGVNLPEATYIINYDVPMLHSSYLQRLSRGSRIDAREGGILVVKTMIGKGTVEEGSVRVWNRRNEWSDKIQDYDADEDSDFVSATDRLALIRRASREEVVTP